MYNFCEYFKSKNVILQVRKENGASDKSLKLKHSASFRETKLNSNIITSLEFIIKHSYRRY